MKFSIAIIIGLYFTSNLFSQEINNEFAIGGPTGIYLHLGQHIYLPVNGISMSI